MPTSFSPFRAVAIVSLLLAACTPTDRSGNQAGYAVLEASQEHARPSRDAVGVVEFFMYACRHCDAFDAPLHTWAQQRPAIHLQRVPIAFSARDLPLQRLYFAVQTLPDPEQLHRRIFNAIHQQKLTLDSETAISDFMLEQGISRTAFLAAYRASGVQQQVDRALAQRNRYAIRAVPSIVVGERFLTSPAMVQDSALTDPGQSTESATIRMLDDLLERSVHYDQAPLP